MGWKKLGRTSSHRWAMLRTMVTQLIENERIVTTVAKAKELRKLADRMVTLGKKGNVLLLCTGRLYGAQRLFVLFAILVNHEFHPA